MTHPTTKLLAALCARSLDGLKAERLVTLDLHDIESAPADYFLVCTANSDVHARALADTIARTADTAGFDRPKTEGRDAAEWILLDFFDVVVHIFRTDAREYYKLEKLWGDAPQVDIFALEREELAAEAQKAKEEKEASKAKPKRAKKAAEPATEGTSLPDVSSAKASSAKSPAKRATPTRKTKTAKSPATTQTGAADSETPAAPKRRTKTKEKTNEKSEEKIEGISVSETEKPKKTRRKKTE